ncbi:flagellar protein FlaG [Anaeroselena agilis]|uniref:Flagellar protein FlaG n=1 Tax=Anaeroselena agilis TaxID=3063788 RepID=A0ABU3P4F3_9FIRM|nr:flagellar protein FlaG [Selenomonadales bacterium 4137-cl]
MEVNKINPAVLPDQGMSGAAVDAKVFKGNPDAQQKMPAKQSSPQEDPTPEEMENVTDAMNKFMESLNADLQFAIHEKTNRMMVRVVDVKTHKVLKEFPPHELLDTLAAISEYVGALLDKKV